MSTETLTTALPQEQASDTPAMDMDAYVEKRYDNAIGYYWKAGAVNKRTDKLNRSLIIILGAAVTLLSSLLSASFIANND